MGYEVDFIPVGTGTKSGDAIALRFGDLHSGKRTDFTVVVIDGGYKESGEAIVEHIKEYYGTDHIDLVVSTHPDADHCNGLQVVLEKCSVGKLWMHRPWLEEHTNDIADLFEDGRVTDKSVANKLRDSLDSAWTLEKLAIEKNIPINEPFAGLTLPGQAGTLKVLGPTKEYYESLLPDFRGTPEPKKEDAAVKKGFLEKIVDFAKNFVEEQWDVETLSATSNTSAENSSGTILLLTVDDRHLLFTSDTGEAALTQIVADLPDLTFIQVPHHGSRHNVTPSLLDALVGPKLPKEPSDGKTKMSAFASCAEDGAPRHPAKQVANAFRRRGAPIVVTQGTRKRSHYDAPKRDGWSTAKPLEFFTKVESDGA